MNPTFSVNQAAHIRRTQRPDQWFRQPRDRDEVYEDLVALDRNLRDLASELVVGRSKLLSITARSGSPAFTYAEGYFEQMIAALGSALWHVEALTAWHDSTDSEDGQP